MKQMITLALACSLLLFISCKDEVLEELNIVKQNYEADKNFDTALNLGEIYSLDYVRKMEEAHEGLLWFEQALEDYPDSLELRVMQGNLYTLKGNLYFEDKDYTRALQYVEEGIRIMDDAVAADPENSFLLVFRGINNATLPELFERTDTAIGDLKHLIEMGEEGTDAKTQILAMYNLMLLYDNRGMDNEYTEMKERLQALYPLYTEVVGK